MKLIGVHLMGKTKPIVVPCAIFHVAWFVQGASFLRREGRASRPFAQVFGLAHHAPFTGRETRVSFPEHPVFTSPLDS